MSCQGVEKSGSTEDKMKVHRPSKSESPPNPVSLTDAHKDGGHHFFSILFSEAAEVWGHKLFLAYVWSLEWLNDTGLFCWW